MKSFNDKVRNAGKAHSKIYDMGRGRTNGLIGGGLKIFLMGAGGQASMGEGRGTRV